jgi:hypothetical protein
MENNFSITDIRLMQGLMSKKSDAEIAELLDKPVEAVHDKIAEISGISGKMSFAATQEVKQHIDDEFRLQKILDKQANDSKKDKPEKSGKQAYKVWSETEVQWLKQNALQMTVKDMAKHLKRDYSSVRIKVTKLQLFKDAETLKKIYARPNPGHFMPGTNGRKSAGIKKVNNEDFERKKAIETHKKLLRNQEEARKTRREKENKPAFSTKQVDMSQLISVRIDHKTTVFVKPGTDIEAVRKQYAARLKPDSTEISPLSQKKQLYMKGDKTTYQNLEKGDRFFLDSDLKKVSYEITKHKPDGAHEYMISGGRPFSPARSFPADTKVIFFRHT